MLGTVEELLELLELELLVHLVFGTEEELLELLELLVHLVFGIEEELLELLEFGWVAGTVGELLELLDHFVVGTGGE